MIIKSRSKACLKVEEALKNIFYTRHTIEPLFSKIYVSRLPAEQN